MDWILPTTWGDQCVLLKSTDSDADLITISHDAHSRRGFAIGAVLAAEYTKDHNGLLTISDMFKF